MKPTKPARTAVPQVRPDTLADWRDVDSLLGWMRVQLAQKASLASTADAQIAEIEERRNAAIKPIDDELKSAELQITAFAIMHRKTMGRRKSMKLTHGDVGFRAGAAKVELTEPESAVIHLCRVTNNPQCVETVSRLVKDELKKLDPAQLARIGVKLIQDEVAFVKPRGPDTPDYPETSS